MWPWPYSNHNIPWIYCCEQMRCVLLSSFLFSFFMFVSIWKWQCRPVQICDSWNRKMTNIKCTDPAHIHDMTVCVRVVVYARASFIVKSSSNATLEMFQPFTIWSWMEFVTVAVLHTATVIVCLNQLFCTHVALHPTLRSPFGIYCIQTNAVIHTFHLRPFSRYDCHTMQ